MTISGVTYSKAESGVILTATRTSGMSRSRRATALPSRSSSSDVHQAPGAVPGEVAAPRTASGKPGTPPPQTAGTAFTVTVNAVDASWNVVSSTHRVGITSSDANATLPANAALVAGTGTFSVTLKTAGSRTVTASDITDSTKTASTSSPITVNAGAFTKLQLLVPGETAAPGTASGKTGTPTTQGAGAPFNVTVNAVDASWNVASSAHTVAITSSDAAATLPASAALVAGTRTFSLTLRTVGTRTVTATDISDGSKTASTSPPITVVSPASLSLVRSRGMIAYGESVTFSVQLGPNGGNRPIALEYHGAGAPFTTIADWSPTVGLRFVYLCRDPDRLLRAASPRRGIARRRARSTSSASANRHPVPHHAGARTIARGTSIASAPPPHGLDLASSMAPSASTRRWAVAGCQVRAAGGDGHLRHRPDDLPVRRGRQLVRPCVCAQDAVQLDQPLHAAGVLPGAVTLVSGATMRARASSLRVPPRAAGPFASRNLLESRLS